LTGVAKGLPLIKYTGVRRQDYGNCNFTGSSIQMSFSPISHPQLCNG